MANLNYTISVEMQRRRAEVTIKGAFWTKTLKLEEGTYPCHVLGIFQECDGEETYVVAVCELYNGRLITPEVANVRYTDTDEKTGFIL